MPIKLIDTNDGKTIGELAGGTPPITDDDGVIIGDVSVVAVITGSKGPSLLIRGKVRGISFTTALAIRAEPYATSGPE